MRAGALILLALLAGCATTCPPPEPPRVIDTSCQWLPGKLVTVAPTDDPETIRKAVALARAVRENCPEK